MGNLKVGNIQFDNNTTFAIPLKRREDPLFNFPEEWEERFEDHAYRDSEYGDIRIYAKSLGNLMLKYLDIPMTGEKERYPDDYPKIKVKCKKDKILIEKIED